MLHWVLKRRLTISHEVLSRTQVPSGEYTNHDRASPGKRKTRFFKRYKFAFTSSTVSLGLNASTTLSGSGSGIAGSLGRNGNGGGGGRNRSLARTTACRVALRRTKSVALDACNDKKKQCKRYTKRERRRESTKID